MHSCSEHQAAASNHLAAAFFIFEKKSGMKKPWTTVKPEH